MKKERRITRKRRARVLGPLEHEILDVLWVKSRASGKEIFSEINGQRNVALTTVLTVLKRLVAKDLVQKVKGESVYLYAPVHTKDEFAREVSAEVLRDIFEISTSGVAATFVDMLAQEDPDELDRLSALIESKKKGMSSNGR